MQPPEPLYHMNQRCPSAVPEALTEQDMVPAGKVGGVAAQSSGARVAGAGVAGVPVPIPAPGWPVPAAIPLEAGGGLGVTAGEPVLPGGILPGAILPGAIGRSPAF